MDRRHGATITGAAAIHDQLELTRRFEFQQPRRDWLVMGQMPATGLSDRSLWARLRGLTSGFGCAVGGYTGKRALVTTNRSMAILHRLIGSVPEPASMWR